MPETNTFTDSDGVVVSYYHWWPDQPVRGVVFIAHGASEHGARYDRFAQFLTGHGLAVYAQDHRGHGNTGKSTGVGLTGPNGWMGLINDQHELIQMVMGVKKERVPVILFAHSMGSFMAQRYIQLHGDEIDGVVLSGSAGDMGDLNSTIEFIDLIAQDTGLDTPAPSLSTFNEKFEPARTAFDWLSRDPAEVDKYIADPFCGDDNPLTIGYGRELYATLRDAWDPANEAKLRKDLPVLFITGEVDPVSQEASTVRLLEQRYRDHGLTDVTALYYPDARHELLNETNRDEVQADVLAWIDRVVAAK